MDSLQREFILKFLLIFKGVVKRGKDKYYDFLNPFGDDVFNIKEVRRMELKELVLEIEVLEEKIAPASVSGGRP